MTRSPKPQAAWPGSVVRGQLLLPTARRGLNAPQQRLLPPARRTATGTSLQYAASAWKWVSLHGNPLVLVFSVLALC